MVSRLQALARDWRTALRDRSARGARGPHTFILVDQPDLREAGPRAVSSLHSTAVVHVVRMERSILELSVCEFGPAGAVARFHAPDSSDHDCLRFCLLLFRASAALRHVRRKQTTWLRSPLTMAPVVTMNTTQKDEPHQARHTSVSYLPDHDRVVRHKQTSQHQGEPGPASAHELTRFVRNLPRASTLARSARPRRSRRQGPATGADVRGFSLPWVWALLLPPGLP